MISNKPFYLGEAHNWENESSVVQVLCYDTQELRDRGEQIRKGVYYEHKDTPPWNSGWGNDREFLKSRRSLKLRAVQEIGGLYIPIIRDYDGVLLEEYATYFETTEECLEFLKTKIHYVKE